MKTKNKNNACAMYLRGRYIETTFHRESSDKASRKVTTKNYFDDYELVRIKKEIKNNLVSNIVIAGESDSWQFLWREFEDQCNMHLVFTHNSREAGKQSRITELLVELFQSDRLKATYIPPRSLRELRDLSRYRDDLIESYHAIRARIGIILKSTMICTKPECFANLENEIDQISSSKNWEEKISSIVDENTCIIITSLFKDLKETREKIAFLEKSIKSKSSRYEEKLERIIEIPCVGRVAAENLLFETGFDLERFHDVDAFVSWLGLFRSLDKITSRFEHARLSTGSKNRIRKNICDVVLVVPAMKNCRLKRKFGSDQVKFDVGYARINMEYIIFRLIYNILVNNVTYLEVPDEFINEAYLPD